MDANKRRLIKRISLGVAAFIALVLFIILLVYIVLRPTKPVFILQDITDYKFNLSHSGLLTSNQQITLYARNPNKRIGIYFKEMKVFANYKTEQISSPAPLGNTYLGYKSIITWSPFLYEKDVPLSRTLNQSLADDLRAKKRLLNIKVMGRVRFRVGDIVLGNYHLDINCPVLITYHRLDFPGCDVNL